MAAMTRTRFPGVYRRGSRFVVAYRDSNGKQRRESARTLEEARKLKAAREADVARGEFHPAGAVTFETYAREWVERYRGRGRRGFREGTREDYRRDLERAYRFFGKRRKLTEITPRDVANFAAWLCDPVKVGVKLSERPCAACFARCARAFARRSRRGLSARTRPATWRSRFARMRHWKMSLPAP